MIKKGEINVKNATTKLQILFPPSLFLSLYLFYSCFCDYKSIFGLFFFVFSWVFIFYLKLSGVFFSSSYINFVLFFASLSNCHSFYCMIYGIQWRLNWLNDICCNLCCCHLFDHSLICVWRDMQVSESVRNEFFTNPLQVPFV